MALTATFGELTKESSKKHWRLHGHQRLVKVRAGNTPVASLGPGPVGYVTQEKYLFGLTPREIERDLGLKSGMLSHGASLYALTRLPLDHEFEFKIHTGFPGGDVFDFDVLNNPATRRNYWPPGAGFPQWDVRASIPLRLICQLIPNQPYPRYPKIR